MVKRLPERESTDRYGYRHFHSGGTIAEVRLVGGAPLRLCNYAEALWTHGGRQVNKCVDNRNLHYGLWMISINVDFGFCFHFVK